MNIAYENMSKILEYKNIEWNKTNSVLRKLQSELLVAYRFKDESDLFKKFKSKSRMEKSRNHYWININIMKYVRSKSIQSRWSRMMGNHHVRF